MPALAGIDGYVGMSLMVDRDSGRCIATSAWESAEAMRASENQVRPVRDRAAEMFGGTGTQVDEWEIALLHRNQPTHEGACVRATWIQGDPANADRGIDAFRMTSLPQIEELDGFCSASLMIDRNTGRAVGSVTFDSRETLDRSRDRGEAIRAAGTQDAGVRVLEVAEFELAVAHLRVPEMA